MRGRDASGGLPRRHAPFYELGARHAPPADDHPERGSVGQGVSWASLAPITPEIISMMCFASASWLCKVVSQWSAAVKISSSARGVSRIVFQVARVASVQLDEHAQDGHVAVARVGQHADDPQPSRSRGRRRGGSCCTGLRRTRMRPSRSQLRITSWLTPSSLATSPSGNRISSAFACSFCAQCSSTSAAVSACCSSAFTVTRCSCAFVQRAQPIVGHGALDDRIPRSARKPRPGYSAA